MTKIIACRLESLRTARGLSQRTLARAAGITRQTVGAIESGRVQPSVGIALSLARVLGCTVEELFDLPADPPRRAFDAVAREHLALEPTQRALPTIFVAGCDVAAGLLARHAMLRERDLHVLWLPMTNRAALDELRAGSVHAAVLHGETGTRLAREGYERFELATTEEGWLLARDNPLRFRGAGDIARTRARLVNRPRGAAARALLDERLRGAKLEPQRIRGYDREVAGQVDAGRAIAQGFADVAVGMASVARIFSLDFIPLREERCTLVVASGALRVSGARVLLETLRSQAFRRDVHGLDAYDLSRAGERIA
ncbi:MAG TPA: substrate-binding domain-containing protein [Candidatus Baltobacteraceae bacterium]|nr:substrate-binding domain-containing protein [Candidatus Baltobacteraceae bacterium]